jgi:ATP-dependent Lon protease
MMADYAREPGLRVLQQLIGRIARKAAARVVNNLLPHLRSVNAAFDDERFILACGLDVATDYSHSIADPPIHSVRVMSRFYHTQFRAWYYSDDGGLSWYREVS